MWNWWDMWISFAIVWLLIIFYLIFSLWKPLDLPPVEKEVQELHTGDLVGIAYQSVRGRLVRIFTGSTWTHVGMVVRVGKKVYVIEMAAYDHAQGVICTRWKEFWNWNRGRVLCVRPYRGPPWELDKLRAFVRQTKKERSMDLNAISWLSATMRWTHDPKSTRRSHYCSEYIALVLQHFGRLATKYDPCSFQPWELLYGQPGWLGQCYGEAYTVFS